MTEDNPSSGSTQVNILNGTPFDAIGAPANIESVIAPLRTGSGGTEELWKLNHYYERLDEWYEDKGVAKNPFLAPAAEPIFELHNLTADPEERLNRAADANGTLSQLTGILETQRDEKRLIPTRRNPIS